MNNSLEIVDLLGSLSHEFLLEYLSSFPSLSQSRDFSFCVKPFVNEMLEPFSHKEASAVLLNEFCTVILILHQKVFLIGVHFMSKILQL